MIEIRLRHKDTVGDTLCLLGPQQQPLQQCIGDAYQGVHHSPGASVGERVCS